MKYLHIALSLLLISSPTALAAVKLDSSGKTANFLYEKDTKALASTVQLVFRTGSMADPKGKEGLAMLSFQSLLRGTKMKNKQEFFAAVERLGASIDADVSTDRTIISLNTVSENLEPALQLLAEVVLQPSLNEEDIQAVREEHLAMLNQELASNRKLLKRVFRQALYHGTPLAFPPEGTLTGVGSISTDDVRTFLAKQVRGGNAIFAVASNRPEAEVIGWIEKYFSAIPEGKAPTLPVIVASPIDGRNLYVLERQGSSTTEVGIGHLGVTADRKDMETLSVGLFALGEDMSSRLFQELRAKKGWTYGAYAGFKLYDLPRYYGGGFLIWAFPQAEHTEELVLRALDLYQDYVKSGLTEKELEFSKKSLMNSYPFKFATSRSRLTSRLYQLLERAPNHSVSTYRGLVNKVNLKTLLGSIQKAHDPNNLAIVLVGDPSKTASLQKSIPNLKKVVKITDPMKAL